MTAATEVAEIHEAFRRLRPDELPKIDDSLREEDRLVMVTITFPVYGNYDTASHAGRSVLKRAQECSPCPPVDSSVEVFGWDI